MRRTDPFLITLLCVFVILATTYAVVVPLFEGPDEDDHFRYVKFLADHRALPMQLFQAGGGEAGHQGWQPPLYYALAALLVAPVDTSDYEQHLQRNPAAALTGDIACCGRNQYFHFSEENFPYQRTALAVHLARGVTILFGLGAVYAIYWLTLALFPSNRYFALATTALATLNPSFLFSSALVSNDIPLVTFCTLALLVMAQVLTGMWKANGKSFALLGVLLALALLVKTTALALVPVALVAVAYLAYRARSWRVIVVGIIGIVIPILVFVGWWFVRNQILYGDALALRLVAASALPPRDAPLTLAELVRINLPWLWQTFWGGPTPGDFPQVLLVGLLIAFGVACVGTIGYFAREWRGMGQGRRVMFGLIFGWLLLILVAQLQFIRTASGTDQGRYLFPAISTIALIFVVGWNEIVWQVGARMRRGFTEFEAQRGTATVITAFALALPAFVLVAFTLPAYAAPAPFDSATLEQHGAHIQASFKNGMLLRGYSLSARAISCGDKLGVTLFWTSERRIKQSFRVFAHLVGENGAVAGNMDVIPGHGAYPTVYWKPGNWLADTISIPLNRGARAGNYKVIVGTYKIGEPDQRVNLQGSQDDFVTLGDVQVNAPEGGCS
ncbi:MAG TPA: phospholipid carrier-dependent glycosyltransferase [Anaerolineae bacterium]|nr:phospholipid carrier-dependent glycosyltransferase [Anaerolineae bacterium]